MSSSSVPVDAWHLAQFNVAKIRYPLEDPRMAGFVDNLDRINTLGDESPGWVWRYSTDSGNSMDERIFDDPDIALNYTIWEDVDSLKDYTYRTDHKDFLRRRREWFVQMPEWPIVVLWWVPAGTIPPLTEAKARLLRLRDHGSSPDAFTFRESYPPPEQQSA